MDMIGLYPTWLEAGVGSIVAARFKDPAFKKDDSARGMRTFAKKLTRTEIEALATYYADLSAGPADQAR